VRGDLLARLGRQQAAVSFTRAAELTSNTVERLFLRDRASACIGA
jgi:predicted RNA polymerase sigma factor